jgi:hypothetical protein
MRRQRSCLGSSFAFAIKLFPLETASGCPRSGSSRARSSRAGSTCARSFRAGSARARGPCTEALHTGRYASRGSSPWSGDAGDYGFLGSGQRTNQRFLLHHVYFPRKDLIFSASFGCGTSLHSARAWPNHALRPSSPTVQKNTATALP